MLARAKTPYLMYPPSSATARLESKSKVGSNRLPLSLTRLEAHPYSLVWRERTPEEALELAYIALSSRLSALAGEAELLQKQITTKIGEDSIVHVCQVSCIQDIAVQQEFEITE